MGKGLLERLRGRPNPERELTSGALPPQPPTPKAPKGAELFFRFDQEVRELLIAGRNAPDAIGYLNALVGQTLKVDDHTSFVERERLEPKRVLESDDAPVQVSEWRERNVVSISAENVLAHIRERAKRSRSLTFKIHADCLDAYIKGMRAGNERIPDITETPEEVPGGPIMMTFSADDGTTWQELPHHDTVTHNSPDAA